jgi:WD40 repeat protein
MSSTPPTSPSGLSTASASLPLPRVPDHELLKRIGRGAYGEVWLARSVTGAFRAVKIVHRQTFDHDRPFEREFEGILKFEPVSRQHESQVDILHVGRGKDCFYYVMELADDQATGGQINPDHYTPRTLKSEVLSRSRVPFEECVRIGLSLATALEHLHGNGLVHRDVKPSNIIFINGSPKLADIGLVTGIDATRSYVGTEGFAAPEGPGSPQGDLYSLGKVLYEISTGKDRQEFPELPTQLRELPDREGLMELNAVIAKACRHDPKDRYDSSTAMRADLEVLQSGRSLARLHRVEKQLRFVRRAGVLVTALAALVAVGWLWQARQTGIVRRLATEKAALAEEKTKLSEDNRQYLVRLGIANGIRLLDEGDPSAALLWFAEALPLVTNRPAEEAIHRIRIQQTLEKTPRLMQVFPNTTNTSALSFSPDGRRIATGSGPDGKLHVWDTRTGEALMQPLAFDVEWIWQTRFTRDGQRLFVSSLRPAYLVTQAVPQTNIAAIVEIQSGRQIVSVHATNLVRADFSPDERWIVTADSEHIIRVHDARDGKPISEFKGHTNVIFRFAFSADGNVLASSSEDRTVRLWRLPSGEAIGLPLQFARDQLMITLSHDGRLLATSAAVSDANTNSTVQTWDVETGASLGSPIQLDGEIQTLVFVPPEGQRLCAVTDKEQGLFDAQSHVRSLPPIPIERSFANWVTIPDAISPDGHHIALGGSKGLEGVWNLESGEREFPACHQGRTFTLVEFSLDGSQLAAISDDGACFLWDVRPRPDDASHQFNADIRNGPPQAPVHLFSPDRRRFLVILLDKTVRLVDAERLVEVEMPGPRPTNSVPRNCVFDATGHQWAIAYAGTQEFIAELWREESGILRQLALPQPQGIVVMCFSPDGTRLLTRNYDGKVRIWRTSDGTLEQTITLPESWSYGDILSDGRTLLSVEQDGHLAFFDLETSASLPVNTSLRDNHGPSGELSMDAYALDQSGERFAGVTAEGWGRVWSTHTGKPLTPLLRNNGRLNWVHWSPDNKRILMSGATPEVTVWDAVSGEASLPPLRIGDKSIETAMWSLDGRFIVARSDENAARVWDAATGEAVTPLLKHSSYLRLAHLVANNRLITISLPNKLRAWDLKESKLPPDVLADYAKLTSGRKLNAGGVPVPMPPAELAALCRSLRVRAPLLFE